MRLPRGESQAQRLARPEQVLLADHLVRRLRAQLLGQRSGTINGVLGKQIAQWNFLSGDKGLILEAASLPPHLKLPKSNPIQR